MMFSVARSDQDRQHIQDRERWKRDLAARIRETKQQMMKLTDNQLEITTKRTIMENEQMSNELAYQRCCSGAPPSMPSLHSHTYVNKSTTIHMCRLALTAAAWLSCTHLHAPVHAACLLTSVRVCSRSAQRCNSLMCCDITA
jgi:hypothetical protein